MKPNLESDLQESQEIRSLVQDDSFANELYAALCNIIWLKDGEEWACSWRYAGGIVVSLRKSKDYKYYKNSADEEFNFDYCEFYCSGNEGTVSNRVREALERLGWSFKHYESENI